MLNPRFHRLVLLLAAAYNLAWGTLVIAFPQRTLTLLGMPDATPHLWQCIGMIVGVYGVGYAIAASDPRRHWPIVLVGLLGKILGPLGYVSGAWRGDLPWAMGWTILTNDLIWWAPFAAILWHAALPQPGTPAPAPPPAPPATRTLAEVTR